MSSAAQYVFATSRDPKRYGWLLSILLPLVVWIGPILYLRTGRLFPFWLPLIFFYAVVPLLDWVLGRDSSNHSEEASALLEQDIYYRAVTWLIVPCMYVSWFFLIWFAATYPLPLWTFPLLVMGIGSVGGFCINVAHEMGHRGHGIERWLTKLVLAPSAYGHFTIDHNRGHHREVSTFEDHASARMGESIYRFSLRELPGAFLRSWELEKERLARKGRRAWSLHNDIIQTLLVTFLLWTGTTLWLGWRALPFILVSAFWANFQLTSANYIEHYGLARKRLPNGKYEPCEPRHSRNSDFKLSNYALLHLQRHSDHHAWPTRPYQILRHCEDVPEMPNGYFGMFVLAYYPFLWFRIMDPLLVKAVNGDPERVNFSPKRRQQLMRKYFPQVPISH